MIAILFVGHAETVDNAAGVASGHGNPPLTDRGREYASTTLRARYRDQEVDVVFTSDTQRAFDTARLIFEGRGVAIRQDARLRECDYGDLEGRPRHEMEAARERAVTAGFPHGESYVQVAERMRRFLDDLADRHDGENVFLVGHRATLVMLEHWIAGRGLDQAVATLPAQPWLYHIHPEQWRSKRR